MATAHISTTKLSPPPKGVAPKIQQVIRPAETPEVPAAATAQPATQVVSSTEPAMTLAGLREAKARAEEAEKASREESQNAKRATNDLLRTLQTVKVMAPLLRAVAVRPGPEHPGEQMQAVSSLVRAFLSSREQMVDAIAPDGLPLASFERTRIRNAVTQVVAETMGTMWDRHGSFDMQSTIIEWVNLIDDISPALGDDPLPAENKVSTTLELELSLVRAVGPLQLAIAKWDFWHPEPRELLAQVSREVWNMSADAAHELIEHHQGVKAPGTIIATMQSLLHHGVTTLAWRWNRAGDQAEQQLAKLSPVAIEKLRAQYAESGMPIDKMMTAFKQDFADLIHQAREAVAKNALAPPAADVNEPK